MQEEHLDNFYSSRQLGSPGVQDRFPTMRQCIVQITGHDETRFNNRWIYKVSPVQIGLVSALVSEGYVGSLFDYKVSETATQNLPQGIDANDDAFSVMYTNAINGYEIDNDTNRTMVLNGQNVNNYDSENTYEVKPLPIGLCLLATLFPLVNASMFIPGVDEGEDALEPVTFSNRLLGSYFWFFSAPNPVSVVCGD